MCSSLRYKKYHVNAVHCDYSSSDEGVYQSLRRATGSLSNAWEKLTKAQRIGIKFNQDGTPGRVVTYKNHRQQLVSDPVVRATFRLLREQTRADLCVIDVPVEGIPASKSRQDCTQIQHILREFDVPFMDGNSDSVVWTSVPGGGQMFDKYPVLKSTTEIDELVSVQKLKNHMYMGVTLCLKNLFGLMPFHSFARPRGYYHHLVRMPYMLADLGRIFNPALNIIDGLVCQAGEEWGKGEAPRIGNTLIAGDQVIATDSCGAYLMGHNPKSDWLTEPFHRDRNALLVAAESGFGTVDIEAIDFESEVRSPVGKFYVKQLDPLETIVSWRRTTAEQGLYYLQHQNEIMAKHAGEYILLQMGKICWSGEIGNISTSRRILAGAHPEQALWMKYVDPTEEEGEQFGIYEKTLHQINQIPC